MSLLEVLVSLLVFSFGLLGIVALQARSMRITVDTEDRARAAMLANELVSQMWVAGSTSLSKTSTDAWKTTMAASPVFGLPGLDYDISKPDAAGVVTIKILWKSVSHGDGVYVTQLAM